MKFKKILPFLLISCLFLNGCWDKVEIDKKAFISTIGIDVGKDIGKQDEIKNVKINEPTSGIDLSILKIIYGFPDISELGPQKQGSAKEKSITVDCYSMEDALDKATERSSRSLHLGHTKLLILSNEIMQYPHIVKQVIDYLQREPNLNRMMWVVLSEGKVEEYINFKPQMEKNIETYISGIMENSNKNSNILPVTLNEFLILLNENGNAIVPRVKIDKEKNEVALIGTGIIKNYKLAGYLNAFETSNLEILRGKLKGGKKTIFEKGYPIDYSIEGLKRKIKVKEKDNKLVFNINIEIEGQIKNYYRDNNSFSKDTINKLEKGFNKSIEKECQSLIRKTQREFHIDPFELNDYIEKYHPFLWKKIKKNWEQVYEDAIINVKIDTQIRRIGVTK